MDHINNQSYLDDIAMTSKLKLILNLDLRDWGSPDRLVKDRSVQIDQRFSNFCWSCSGPGQYERFRKSVVSVRVGPIFGLIRS